MRHHAAIFLLCLAAAACGSSGPAQVTLDAGQVLKDAAVDLAPCTAPNSLWFATGLVANHYEELIDLRRGGAWSLASGDATSPNAVLIDWRFPVDAGLPSERWVRLTDPAAPLAVGHYAKDAGLSFQSGAIDCPDASSSFDVVAVERDGGAVNRFTAVFQSTCAGGNAVAGCVNATVGLEPDVQASDAGPVLVGGILGDLTPCALPGTLYIEGDPADPVHPGSETFSSRMGQVIPNWGLSPSNQAIGIGLYVQSRNSSQRFAQAYFVGEQSQPLQTGKLYHATGALVPYGFVGAWNSACPQGADGRIGSQSDLYFQVSNYTFDGSQGIGAVTFYQRCAGAPGALRGCFRF